MSDEREIWESARKMIERYGDDARHEVKLRIRELEERGQSDARRYWKRIEKALETLLGNQGSDLSH